MDVPIPQQDIDDALKCGYRHIRAVVGGDGKGKIWHSRIEVRTGFDVETGQEVWQDLEVIKARKLAMLEVNRMDVIALVNSMEVAREHYWFGGDELALLERLHALQRKME